MNELPERDRRMLALVARASRRCSGGGGGKRMSQTRMQPRLCGGKVSVAGIVMLVIAFGIGIAAGAYWNERIRHALGLHRGGHAAATTQQKKQLWTCGMHPQVIQNKPGNCPICGMALEPLKMDETTSSTTAPAERKIKYWWDPMMNPPYISDKPGKSPMGMDLVPVYEDEVLAGAVVKIDPVVVQNMGVRVAEATIGPVKRVVRAVGTLQEAQPNIQDVNLRVSGWIERLYADTEGQFLRKRDALFDLYSPQVQVAVEELIIARRGVESLGESADPATLKSAQTLLDAAKRKLEQWGIDADQIERLSRMPTAPRTVRFISPIDGHLVEKMIVQGSAVETGMKVLRLVDHSMLWLDVQVHAQDLPFVKAGQPVRASIEGVPGRQFDGKVIFVHPHVDAMTRTALVRMAMPNPELSLRPGMFATVWIESQIQDQALLVPREAVIDTGQRQIVFVPLENGHFEPRKVTVGVWSDDGNVQLLSGVAPGEQVVVSGQFLLDSESRMREAIQKHLDKQLLAAGAKPAEPPTTQHQHPTTRHASTQSTPGTAHWQHAVDEFIRAYLTIGEKLGAVQASEDPVDASRLIETARLLSDHATTPQQKQIATRVMDAAARLGDAPIEQQRELFKIVSDAAIELALSWPVSRELAQELYVWHCPMAQGNWLQATKPAANPYYATTMKQCAVLKQTVATGR
ncbi:efflux RND transporter periplasmic adaptor subunit [Fontivita pretiosa]|uniref:efflux RND transporter periplasmic adaptor subunit n=1 Tax=Fontivita pretiosa TaxID=2989684 RepID=UPI003D17BE2B